MDLNVRSIREDTGAENANFPIYEGIKEVDIVVIGGGITGLTAALLKQCRQKGDFAGSKDNRSGHNREFYRKSICN